MLLVTVWVIQIIFMPPMFPSGGFVISRTYPTQEACQQDLWKILVPNPSLSAICMEENGASWKEGSHDK